MCMRMLVLCLVLTPGSTEAFAQILACSNMVGDWEDISNYDKFHLTQDAKGNISGTLTVPECLAGNPLSEQTSRLQRRPARAMVKPQRIQLGSEEIAMRNVFFPVLFLAALIVPCVAQDSLTVTSDERDLSRPISTLINEIRRRERVSITYEDPRYVNSTDIEDVTVEVSKGSDLDKTHGPPILVPKGRPISFVYVPARMHKQNSAKATIERMLEEYVSLGGPTFAVIGDGTRLHVVPREILDASSTRVHQGSILESRVNVPPAQRRRRTASGNLQSNPRADWLRSWNRAKCSRQLSSSVPNGYRDSR